GLHSSALAPAWLSCGVGGLNFGGNGTRGEAGADGLAGVGFCGVAQEGACGGVDHRVAAVQDGQRRERGEAGCGAVEARGAGGDGSAGEAAERLAGGFLSAAGEGEPDGWVLPLETRREGRKLAGARAQTAVGGESKAVAQVVEALTAAADEGLQPALHLSDRERREALPRQHELVADGAADAGFERLDALLDAVLGTGDEF